VKWQLRDGDGNFVTALGAISAITFRSTSCSSFLGNDPTDALETSTTGGTSIRYDSAANQIRLQLGRAVEGLLHALPDAQGGQVFPALLQPLVADESRPGGSFAGRPAPQTETPERVTQRKSALLGDSKTPG